MGDPLQSLQLAHLIVGTFNNREKAILIWIVIILIYVSTRKDLRKLAIETLNILLNIKMIGLLVALLIYNGLVVLALYRMGLWDVYNIDDAVFWFFGTGLVLLANTTDALKDKQYFKKVALDSLKLVLVLEGIMNLYVFSLWIELIILPSFFIVALADALAETKGKNLPAKKLTGCILFMFGLLLLVFTLYSIFKDFDGFATIHNMRSILSPIFLTALFLPFLYLFAVIMAYENIFLRLRFLIRDNEPLLKYTRLRIIWFCLLDLGRLNRFAANGARELADVKNEKDVLDIFRILKRSD